MVNISMKAESSYTFTIDGREEKGFQRGALFHGMREYTRQRGSIVEAIIIEEGIADLFFSDVMRGIMGEDGCKVLRMSPSLLRPVG